MRNRGRNRRGIGRESQTGYEAEKHPKHRLAAGSLVLETQVLGEGDGVLKVADMNEMAPKIHVVETV